jgi:hypothetical protein
MRRLMANSGGIDGIPLTASFSSTPKRTASTLKHPKPDENDLADLEAKRGAS